MLVSESDSKRGSGSGGESEGEHESDGGHVETYLGGTTSKNLTLKAHSYLNSAHQVVGIVQHAQCSHSVYHVSHMSHMFRTCC